jgi:hypothetical protein
MPKQLIHEGQYVHLVPYRNASDDKRTPAEILEQARETGDWSSFSYQPGRADSREEGDGVVEFQEPTAELVWSKGRGTGDNDPGDLGYVELQIWVDPEQLRRMVQGYDRVGERSEDRPASLLISIPRLSWRDLNISAKTFRQARDDAFGRPE